jgi:hypothetical protein
MELKSDKGTAEIEAGGSTVCMSLPLSFKSWSISELLAGNRTQPAVVISADGDYFIGEVTGVDEDCVLTVELR